MRPAEFPRPSVGRIVHYGVALSDDGERVVPLPAIIVACDDESRTASLQVFGHGARGLTWRAEVPYTERQSGRVGFWTWPPRV